MPHSQRTDSLRPLFAALAMGMSAAACSCGSSGGGATPSPISMQLPRSMVNGWTVLVYMNAANDLEPFSVENIDQMEQAPYNSNVNVVVEWKRLHVAGTSADIAFDPKGSLFDGARRYYLRGNSQQGGYDLDQIQDLGSGPVGSRPATVDMGDAQHLRDFVTWGQRNFPAQHYLVVLWNHGAGWEHRGRHRSSPHRGVSYDDASGHSIETWQLSQALTSTPGLDVIAMDASLLQMAEVDYEMRGAAAYIVGSEDSPPGDGYPYQLWLSQLTANPSMDALSLSKLITDTFGNFYQNHTDSSGVLDSVTQSVVQTSALPRVAQALSAFGDALYANRTAYASQLAQARTQAHEYAIEHGSTSYPEYKDLVEYVNLVKSFAGSAPGVSASADSLLAAVGSAVVDNQVTRANGFSHGLSIYVPVPALQALPPQSYDTSYGNLALARDTSWARFISSQLQ